MTQMLKYSFGQGISISGPNSFSRSEQFVFTQDILYDVIDEKTITGKFKMPSAEAGCFTMGFHDEKKDKHLIDRSLFFAKLVYPEIDYKNMKIMNEKKDYDSTKVCRSYSICYPNGDIICNITFTFNKDGLFFTLKH